MISIYDKEAIDVLLIHARPWLEAQGWYTLWSLNNWVNPRRMETIEDSSGVDILTAIIMEMNDQKIIGSGLLTRIIKRESEHG